MECPKKIHSKAKAIEEPTKKAIPSEDEKGRKYEKIEAQVRDWEMGIRKWEVNGK